MSHANTLYQLSLTLLEQLGNDTAMSFRQSLPEVDALSQQPLAPSSLPVVNAIERLTKPTGITAALVAAIQAGSQTQTWRQPYAESDFGEHFFHHVAWFPIADKQGPLLYEKGLMEIMLIDADAAYPSHRHAPEELYIVLAGRVFWQAEGHSPCWKTAGEVIHHQPYQTHAIKAGNEPALILSIWRGGGFEMPEIT